VGQFSVGVNKLGFEDNSMDIVFLSQAFHHADQPLKLLFEVDRITKSGGVVILSGENYISSFMQVKAVIKGILRHHRFCTNFYQNFPPDDIAGDHYYRLTDYYLFFQLLGYKVSHKLVGKYSMVLMAVKL
jgi:ubiquinone/menaquinone biosynthesis C-methylase UbiE